MPPAPRQEPPFKSLHIHIPKKNTDSRRCSFLVRAVGLEPTRRGHWLLRPARLPFRHARGYIIMQNYSYLFIKYDFITFRVFLQVLLSESSRQHTQGDRRRGYRMQGELRQHRKALRDVRYTSPLPHPRYQGLSQE